MASLDAAIAYNVVASQWRARIGRLPRGYEPTLKRLTDTHGMDRMIRAIQTTQRAGLRRTAERWPLFLALFGEAP